MRFIRKTAAGRSHLTSQPHRRWTHHAGIRARCAFRNANVSRLRDMAGQPDDGDEADARFRRIAELRKQSMADAALKPTPPARPAPAKRDRWPVVVTFLFIATTMGYPLAHFLTRTTHSSLAAAPSAPPAVTLPPAPPSTPPAAAPADVAQSPPASTVPTAAPPVARIAAPPATAPTGSTPRVAGPAPENGGRPAGYHVQAGAFNVPEYAQELLGQLRAHGYAATLVDVPTGPPHRVWITGTLDRPGAERLAGRLRSDGFEAILVHP